MKRRLFSVLAIVLALSVFFTPMAFAHPGGLDKNGGHKDNKNLSGLGPYHYHCGKNPAHLHNNGICPYDSDNAVVANNMPASMNAGENVQLSWSIRRYADSSKVTWTSSNPMIISITQSGLLTAISEGTVTITATVEDEDSSYTVKSVWIPAKKIKLSSQNKKAAIGSLIAINYTITPTNTSVKELVWSSDNEDVAIAIKGGTLLAIGKGSCNITAAAKGNSKVTGKIKITVKGGAEKFDKDKVLAELPEGYVFKGKYGSKVAEFAKKHDLPYEEVLPAGLPLSKGDKGEAVRDIQKKLIELKYLSGKADGKFNKKTITAVKKYYKKKGVEFDGVIDEKDYIEIMLEK